MTQTWKKIATVSLAAVMLTGSLASCIGPLLFLCFAGRFECIPTFGGYDWACRTDAVCFPGGQGGFEGEMFFIL